MPEKNDQFYHEVSDAIKSVFDLTSRVDERVKILIEQQSETNQRIERIVERYENISTRVSVLENKNTNGLRKDVSELEGEVYTLRLKVSALEVKSTGYDNKWKIVGDFLFKIAIIIIGGLFALKLPR